jgi:hypothetical protein
MLMARACYDPRAALSVWREHGGGRGSGRPEFLSTHPSHGRRVEALGGWMVGAMAERVEAGCPAPEGVCGGLRLVLGSPLGSSPRVRPRMRVGIGGPVVNYAQKSA